MVKMGDNIFIVVSTVMTSIPNILRGGGVNRSSFGWYDILIEGDRDSVLDSEKVIFAPYVVTYP